MEITSKNIKEIKFDIPEDHVIFLQEFLEKYLVSTEKSILDQDTILVGSWLIKMEIKDSLVSVYEVDPNHPNAFRRGAAFCFELLKKQQRVCRENNLEFSPVPADSLIAFYDDVLENKNPIYGIRSSGDGEVSGFILWTKDSPEDISELKYVHIYELVNKLPSVLEYLALPPGYRFDISTQKVTKDNDFKL